MIFEWQAIETAPRDGSTFLTFSPEFVDDYQGGVDFAGWDQSDRCFWKARCGWDYVTMWAPLPGRSLID